MPELDPSALVRRRRNALLAKWASGKRLSPQEHDEIADFLPKPAPALQLEAQVEGVAAKPFRKGRDEYAIFYGQSVRTINRWMSRSAPLDAPEKMPDWWVEHYKFKVPDTLRELARQAIAITAAPVPAVVPGAPSSVPIPFNATGPLEQARALLQSAYADLTEARRVGERGGILQAQSAYQSASEQLRRVELAAPKIAAASGAVIDREKVRVGIARLHTSIVASLRSAAKRLRREMTGKTAEEQETIWQAGLDKIFARFRDCDFADPA